MTLTTQTTSITDDTTAAAADWAAWHDARDAALTGEHGWLTLTALHHLSSTPEVLPGLPGQWWADETGAHVVAAAGDGLRAADTRNAVDAAVDELDGLHTVGVPEAGTTIVALVDVDGGTQVSLAIEVALRTGGYIARVRDPRAPTRIDFAGVPTYAYDPAWVLDVPVRWYDEPRPAVVGAAQPGLKHHVTLLGELDLTVGDETVTLTITGASPASSTVLFSDASEDTAEWRIVSLEAGRSEAGRSEAGRSEAGRSEAGTSEAGTSGAGASPTLRLDLNRTINLPYAFSDFGTCPRPVDGNALRFAVPAGERAPR